MLIKKLKNAFGIASLGFLLVKAQSADAQQLVHYWNFNDNSTEAALLTPNVSLITGAAITHISGGISSINVSGGTGQDFNINNYNARNNDPSGTHLRFNDPIGGELEFALPTTGFENAVVQFSTRRSGSGAGLQYWSYTTDGSNYIAYDTITPTDIGPVLETLDFSSVLGVNNNANFKIKVAFEQGTGGLVGNNRFDNFTLDASPLSILPTILASPTNLAGFTQLVGAVSDTQSFVISATDLGSDINISAPSGYEISFKGDNTGFTNNLSLSYPSGIALLDTTVYVRLNAISAGNYSGNINISSTGTSNATVQVEGVATRENNASLIYYWHFNNLNTTAGDVKTIDADYSLLTQIGTMSYTGGNAGDRDIDDYSPGSSINLQQGEADGQAARVRNPSAERSLLFDLPTKGCSNLIFEYAVHRSNNGMLNNIVEYSIDGQNFITIDTFKIQTSYHLVSVDLSNISAANNNLNFKIRITWQGNTTEDNGNNRYDNITLSGDVSTALKEIKSLSGTTNLFPNPTTGLLFFNRTLSYRLTDISGKIVVDQNERVDKVDFSHLNSGIYLLKTKEGESFRIILTK